MARMQEHTIPRIVSVAIIPFITLFGFYVHFHGEYSPGGGFQAGVIIASGVILYGLIFDVHEAMRVVPPTFCRALAGGGVLLYGGTGMVSIFLGGEFLNYTLSFGQHYGLVLIELGVLLTVASVMVLIFYAFNSRERIVRSKVAKTQSISSESTSSESQNNNNN